MQTKLLVALDGSRFAEQALPFAIAVARRQNAQLELALVWTPHPRDPDPGRPADYLDGLVGQIGSQLPDAVTRELLSTPADPLEYPPPASNAVADVLAQHAVDVDASLIIVTTHGHGGLRRAWLGSVADSLIRMAGVPVLLIRPEDEEFGGALRADRGLGHVLIPLDGTARAEEAIPHALALGSPFAARYTLLRVVSPLSWDVSPHAYDPYPAFTSPLSRDAVEAELEKVAEPLREAGHTILTHVTDDVSPARAILQYAEEHDIDVIALGTGGAGALRRMILGSVSDKVIRGSEVPVLVCNVRRLQEGGQS
ncbi:MAG TPA: universal stress protein [Longimicrobiales bacterium]|nr:universal stress protein [Longimicrobiales bacterium]